MVNTDQAKNIIIPIKNYNFRMCDYVALLIFMLPSISSYSKQLIRTNKKHNFFVVNAFCKTFLASYKNSGKNSGKNAYKYGGKYHLITINKIIYKTIYNKTININ